MKKSVFLIFLLFLLGCNQLNLTANIIQEKPTIPSETTLQPELYFCPKDNCTEALTNLINSAETTAHCALFDLNLKEVITALAKKSYEADVKVVIDNNNNKGQIKGEGIKFDNSNQLSHNKFCVIDSKIVSTGSFNPTEKDAYKNNNNLIIFHSNYLAENYEAEFQELWNGSFGKGEKVKYPIIYLNNNKIENYFCPDDKCSEQVINNLNSAKESIYFMVFSFTKEEIADAILFKNIDIKGIFDKTQSGSKYSQYWRLKGFGIDVKLDKNKYFLHHKVFIIDNETVITGSFNPSSAGEYKNDENIVIIHDKGIAGKYLEEFDYVWNQ